MRLIPSGAVVRAGFTDAVRDNVRIRSRQLVALDVSGAVPLIAWRWYRGVVEQTSPAGVAIRRLDLEPGNVRVVPDPHNLAPTGGDEVFYGHDENGWSLVGKADGDYPARPADFAERYLPAIARRLS